MAKDLKKFKEFLQQTNYRCAKKNGQPVLVRETSDPDVVYISAEEYLALESGTTAKKAKAAAKPDLDIMSFQELKAYARENGITFAKTIKKAGLLEKIKKSL